MAFLEFKNVRIAGVAAAVPKNILQNIGEAVQSKDYDAEAFVKSTGVKERRIGNLTTSDLCVPAAERLLSDLGWEKSEIEALIFVTQHGDYIVPVTSAVVQGRLGLSEDCYCDDSKHGCSGWLYGMSHVLSLVENGNIKKALLCCGDAKKCYEGYIDPLFGMAGTVTAVEYKPNQNNDSIKFHFGTDGKNFDYVWIPGGGARHPFSSELLKYEEIDGRMYNKLQPRMKGMDVFSMGITVMPLTIRKLSEHFNFDYNDTDYFVFHQANLAMNARVIKKLKLDPEKCPSIMWNFGNTSSACIPLVMVNCLKGKIDEHPTKIIGCTFGVGMTWASVAFTTDHMVISDLIEVEDNPISNN